MPLYETAITSPIGLINAPTKIPTILAFSTNNGCLNLVLTDTSIDSIVIVSAANTMIISSQLIF